MKTVGIFAALILCSAMLILSVFKSEQHMHHIAAAQEASRKLDITAEADLVNKLDAICPMVQDYRSVTVVRDMHGNMLVASPGEEWMPMHETCEALADTWRHHLQGLEHKEDNNGTR